MPVYTTEIASDKITSDNPIHQRLLKPYLLIEKDIKGDVLEVGCGEGRGVDILVKNSDSFTAIDKIQEVIDNLSSLYEDSRFIQTNIPPFGGLEDDSFDLVVSFQVIEHIKDDKAYLSEISRVLKPGGRAFITTPNRPRSLSRNPWHIREYTAKELEDLAGKYFSKIYMRGITGNEKVEEYYQQNKESVNRITRWDIFNLQYNLPAWMLRIPYDILNRFNRNNLQETDDELVKSITHEDYLVTDDAAASLDLFLEVVK